MSLKQCLENILELPEEKLYGEASAKLTKTWVKLNGELVKVIALDKTEIVVANKEGVYTTYHEKKVNKLEIFLPESGVYFENKTNEPLVLFRKPLRQWHKSYYPELYAATSIFGQVDPVNIDESSRTEFWKDKVNRLWYWTTRIGYVDPVKKKVVCTHSHYQQELKDWLTYGKII